MFKWFRRLIGSGSDGGVEAASLSSGGILRQRMVNSLDDLIKTPGKACYRTLIDIAASGSRDEFILSVHCPAFVGAGIRDGNLEKPGTQGLGKHQRTQVFTAAQIEQLIEGASLEQCIFLLRKPVAGPIAGLRRFLVGRTQDNDILMMDFAISRCHAEVEIRGEDYYLKDLGSSNGTYINGRLIDDRGTLLQDCDTVRFARYEFEFLSAGSLFDLLRTRIHSGGDSISSER